MSQEISHAHRASPPARRRARHWILPGLVLGVVMACEGSCCEDPVLVPEDAGSGGPTCNLDEDCGPGDRLSYRFGECRLSGCEADSDCCPGTRCRLDVNACVPWQLDPEYTCDNDGDCDDPAMRCQEVLLEGYDPVLACAYDRCTGDAECGLGRSCFHSVCVKTAPCGGSCPEGTACDVLTGQCADVAAAGESCAQACGDAALRVLSDPDDMSGARCCALRCECKGLPPILPGRFGRYASIAASGEQFLVSGYEVDFGDLAVATFGPAGEFVRVEFVDGVPAQGDIVGDPNGPRGGIADPGPNVGTFTAIATNALGLARIAYHDVDNRSLKVALQGTSGWQTHTVDVPGATGAVGTFTDLAVHPTTGTLYVSYLALDQSGAPGIAGPASGIKLARSRVPNPSSAADWEVRWVDARPTYDPCSGACSTSEACVLRDGAAACERAASSCSPACGASSSCVVRGAGAECLASALPPSLEDFPKARGLHTSLALDGEQALLAYYDSVDGDVRFARVDASGNVTTALVDGDGQGGRRSGDVGRFPVLAKVGGDIVVAYTDFTRHEVVAWRGPVPGGAGSLEVVDGGKVVGEPGKRFVGAGTRLALDGAGRPVLAYQDASQLDLKVAWHNGTNWNQQRVLDAGAHGFYSDLVVREGRAFLVSLLAELDPRGRERSRIAVTVRDLP